MGSLQNESDDENSPLTRGQGNTIDEEPIRWDAFQDTPIKRETGSMASQESLEFIVKILKLFTYLFTFIIVLASGVISKGTLLFMTSHINSTKLLTYCNWDLDRDKQFVVQLPDLERVAWMWCLFFAFCVPELGTFIRSVRMCIFKSWSKPDFVHFLLVFLAETAHTIGLAILVYHILPDLDVVKGAMLTNCVCFIPGLMGILSRNDQEANWFIKLLVDIFALSAQVTGFVVWPLVEGRNELMLIPVSIFLISFAWWENYVSNQSKIPFIKMLGKIKNDLNQKRYYIYSFISIWKIICFFSATCLVIWYRDGTVTHFFSNFKDIFISHNISIQEIKPDLTGTNLPDIIEFINTQNNILTLSSEMTPIYVLLINILTTYFAYIFGKFACKIMIQGFGYAFPVNLTMPVTISLLITFSGLRNEDTCYFHGVIPSYLFFESLPVYSLNDLISEKHAWIWLLWLLSQTWISLHIWSPTCERLASTENLFITPMYNAFLVDQSMAMNRRINDQPIIETKVLNDEIEDDDTESNLMNSSTNNSKSSDSVTKIYICATMWHETRDEMLEFLKSIMRMDEDQSARKIAQEHFIAVDPDYYELETHIFFDDAFTISENDEDSEVNRYVKLLIATIDEAATEVHQTHIHIREPTKFPTPYGGCLEWVLPGKTKLTAHLKDKSKIRHRKRWSQVMYMYYLLGYKLMQQNISIEQKAAIAENTFLLTLDGDIDFQPRAVQLLIDLMKKNGNLGAACGRIHPVGSGPMVWYQMFEYAIGHWLQKATEHMIGCVLCSPGCFSLFRAKALMDDNVMKKYTTESKEAIHYVQYDQGEDRWLCTLLLQRGYRVEYSAASDAFTHCPEGFNEFYNQRRRWIPSTMANIMDLLQDSKRTIKINDNISMPYIAYQSLLMGGTVLGPGTIFLMLVGAFVAAFQIDNWTSFYYNIIPILLFMIVCFFCKPRIQLVAAAVISAVYGLIMMAVLVGIMLQIKNDGPLAPSSVFLFVVGGEMILAGLLHPQELYCLPCGIIYYVTVPSMYLLLIIYSVFNLNIVTWGTREVATKLTKQELEQEKKDAEEAKKKAKQKTLLGFLHAGTDNDDKGSIEFSLAGLFKCMLCTHKKDGEEKIQLLHIAESLDGLGKRLEVIEKQLNPSASSHRRRSTSIASRDHPLNKVQEDPDEEMDSEKESEIIEIMTTEPKEKRDDIINPYWIEDPYIKKGEVDYLSSAETKFWRDLLDKYLLPINENKEEKAEMEGKLKDLRDKAVFAFFMMNALFVLIVFLLTLKKDYLHIKWPFGIKTNITFDESAQEVQILKQYLQLEPIGLVFLFFFGLILVIQFTAMLFHRFGTMSHILASTEINFTKTVQELSSNAPLDKYAVEYIKQNQQLRGIDDLDSENDSMSGAHQIGRRKTVYILEKVASQKRKKIEYLNEAFDKRMREVNKNDRDRKTINNNAVRAFENRRKTIIANREVVNTQLMNGTAPRRDHFDGQDNPAYSQEDEVNDRNAMPMRNRNTLYNNNDINNL